MRKVLIAGNWKMNMTKSEASKLLDELLPKIKSSQFEILVCVPYTDLCIVNRKIQGTNVNLGAQNIAFADQGAYTGEISANMLKDFDVKYAIVGHSERRAMFGETDESVSKRVDAALKANINPIVCVGESEEERNKNLAEKKVQTQILAALKNVSKEQLSKVVIAYEPIWAIGTGKTASVEDAENMIKFIRDEINKKYNEKSNDIRILYGGSMNSKNAKELLAQKDIDGGLIGGASLKAEEFSFICNIKN